MNFLFFAILSLCSAVTWARSEVKIEIQWEESPNAAKYELQILDSKKNLIKTVASSTSFLKFTLPMSRYKVRGRYVTKWGNKSPWSAEEDLEVAPAKPKLNAQTLGRQFVFINSDGPSLLRRVKLNWQASADVEKYKVRVYSKDKKQLLKEFVTDKNTFEFEIESGEFAVSIAAMGPEEIVSSETFIPEILKVDKNQLLPPQLEKVVDEKSPHKFELKFIKANNYSVVGEIYYSHFLSDKWTLLDKKENIERLASTDFQKPGRYKITYWADQVDSIPSAKTSSEEFVIKPQEKDLN